MTLNTSQSTTGNIAKTFNGSYIVFQQSATSGQIGVNLTDYNSGLGSGTTVSHVFMNAGSNTEGLVLRQKLGGTTNTDVLTLQGPVNSVLKSVTLSVRNGDASADKLGVEGHLAVDGNLYLESSLLMGTGCEAYLGDVVITDGWSRPPIDNINSVWSAIDKLAQNISGGGGNAKLFYGTCSTAAGTATKAVVCTEFTSSELVKGALLFVTFDNGNSASVDNLKLNVNSTGDKPMRKLLANSGNSGTVSKLSQPWEIKANQTYLFEYDGTNWVCMTLDYNTNTTYTAMTQSEANTGTSTTARSITAKVLNDTIIGKAGVTMNATSQTTKTYLMGAQQESGIINTVYHNTNIYWQDNNLYSSSDIRLKHDIRKINENLIKCIYESNDPLIYDFNWNDNDSTSTGFIAQYLEEIIPDVVTTDDNGFKAVNYNGALAKLVEILIEKTREQDKRINILENIINKLKAVFIDTEN